MKLLRNPRIIFFPVIPDFFGTIIKHRLFPLKPDSTALIIRNVNNKDLLIIIRTVRKWKKKKKCDFKGYRG